MSDAEQSAAPYSEQGLPVVSPDVIEQDFPDELDNIVPTRGYQMTPMVALGGSAGIIQPLIEFFKTMPADSGLIFVVILHLSPSRDSTLVELLGRATTMKVHQAEDGQRVEPNEVYVIPPGKLLVTVDGHLRLHELDLAPGKRVAVDIFFRSLADTHGPHATAIVLSGADGDGALGIKRIKERGGLAIAQQLGQAEYPGMPSAAIQTGMVDWILDVQEMPQRIIEYYRHAERLKLPPEEGAPPLPMQTVSIDDRESVLREILIFLRTRTGRDFSYYKRATILRRIGRRMQVNGVDDLSSYMSVLRTRAGEAGALLQDLLISVTNFFRDRAVFSALERHIPQLFRNKSQADSVRVWVPACATGEEAYSLAMLLLEHARMLESPPTLQIFACDLDEVAIQSARMGHYPEAITADVSDERLRRFFIKEHQGYRVRRELREMVLFAPHDLLKDAPFSRMDLISCRNLLIYLNAEAQERVFETFHFALNPEGLLLIGSSESIDEGNPRFRPIDKKHRLYEHQVTNRSGKPTISAPSFRVHGLAAHDPPGPNPVVHGKRFLTDAAVPFHGPLTPALDRAALAELHFKLIERFAPPSVIVNAEHEVMHFSEHAGDFLKFTGGEPTMNLLRVVHPSLRAELRSALFRAVETNGPFELQATSAELDGEPCKVDIRVSPATDIAPGLMLITFDKHPNLRPDSGDEARGPRESESAVRLLERELEQVKVQLRDTVEQYEASTEELKASNEELQAMNEELRSATEELETSREELQSINEELTTVNFEMKQKVEEVAHANSDLQNLMASTSIATVFLDRELAIMRYTPSAADIFNLIPGDIGRPLAHLKHKLDYPALLSDVETVLRTLVPLEREVRDDVHWFLARIQPYRTAEDHIAGAVLTLVDITERNQAAEELRRSEERLRLLIESAREYAIFSTDQERRIDSWNSGAEHLFGYAEANILGQSADILFTPEDRARQEPERELQLARERGHAESERWYARSDRQIFYGSGSIMPVRDKSGALLGFMKIMRDLTETKRAQEAIQQHLDELTRFNLAAVGRETRMIELKREINALCERVGEPVRFGLEFTDP
ncbi:MAG TPA: CheR family methyltransferase [Pirellulales bacterium]|jgi:two-component system CheB/CheR fusion protein|nr:CheR family methyltransferase [Pirellulales bacterium]